MLKIFKINKIGTKTLLLLLVSIIFIPASLFAQNYIPPSNTGADVKFAVPAGGQGNVAGGTNGQGYTMFQSNGATFVETLSPGLGPDSSNNYITGIYRVNVNGNTATVARDAQGNLVQNTNFSQLPGQQTNQALPNEGQAATNAFVQANGGGADGYAQYAQATAIRNQGGPNSQTNNGATPAVIPQQVPYCFDFKLTQGIDINYPICASNVANLIMQGMAYVLWISAHIFDTALYYSMGFRKLVDPKQGLAIVTQGWQILRDVANLGLMFVLLYIAFRTILNESGFNTKKLLITTITIAILMNFSFFFASVVIDSSNIIATYFYNEINPTTAGTTQLNTNSVQVFGSVAEKGISGIFLQGLGLITIYNAGSSLQGGIDSNFAKNSQVSGQGVISPWNVVIVGLGGSLLMLITSFVLVAAALMFIFRCVVLIAVLMFSSIAIASYALPQTKKLFDKWLDYLIRYSFFAPVYLLMLYLVTAMIKSGESASATTGGAVNISGNGAQALVHPNFAAMLLGNGSTVTSLFTFIFLIAMMIGSLVIATRIGVYGAGKATEIGKGISNRVRDAAVRNTLNRGARLANKGYDNAVTNTRGLVKDFTNSKFAKNKYVAGTAKYGTIAARTVAGVYTLGGSELALAATKSAVKNVAGSLDKGVKANLKAGEEYKAKDGKNLKEVEKENKDRGEEIKANIKKDDIRQAIAEGVRAAESHEKKKSDAAYLVAGNKEREANENAIGKMQTAITTMSEKEITEQKMSVLMKSAVLETLTDRQLDAVVKNTEKYSDSERKGFIEARFKPIKDNLDKAFKLRNDAKAPGLTQNQIDDLNNEAGKLEGELGKLSERQLDLAGPELLFTGEAAKDEFKMSTLKPEQAVFLTDRNKAQGYSKVQKDKINEVRGRPLKKALDGRVGPAGAGDWISEREALDNSRIEVSKMKAVDVAKKGNDLLKPRLLRALDSSVLQKMKDESTPEIRNKVAKEIERLQAGGFNPGEEPVIAGSDEDKRIDAMHTWILANRSKGF